MLGYYGVLCFSILMYLGSIFSMCMVENRDMTYVLSGIQIAILLGLEKTKYMIGGWSIPLLIVFVYITYFVAIGYGALVAYWEFLQEEY